MQPETILLVKILESRLLARLWSNEDKGTPIKEHDSSDVRLSTSDTNMYDSLTSTHN